MAAERTAWLRTEGEFAIICAWCPDKKTADQRAIAAGFKCSHGICDECASKIFDAGTAPREHSRGAPAKAAAASTPPAPAARVDWINVEVLAKVCGLTSYRLHVWFKPMHWGVPRDWRMEGSRILYHRNALHELFDELAEREETAAADRLRVWWLEQEGVQVPAAVAPLRSAPEQKPAGGWLRRWEIAHES